LEILLSDYVDGTLRADERIAVESHLAQCGPCSELAQDVIGFQGFLERVPAVEPPAELVSRIIGQAPSRRFSWRKLWTGGIHVVLEPRYALGLAMTVLSVAMVARFTHFDARQLSAADLNPVKVWQSLENRTYRVWDRGVKRYETSRLVVETQSQWNAWTDQDLIRGNDRR